MTEITREQMIEWLNKRDAMPLCSHGGEFNEAIKNREMLKAIRAALQQQAQGVEEWQPIDTAPKDRRVLVWTGKNIYVANWVKNIISDHEAFMICDTGVPGYRVIVEPTHWKECPEQPAISATKDGA